MVNKNFSIIKPSFQEILFLSGLAKRHSRYRGCIGHWSFAEGYGKTVYDLSGYNVNGTLVNLDESDWVVNNIHRSLNFELGATDYVTLNDTNKYSFGNGSTDLPVSFVAYARINNSENGKLVARGDDHSANTTYFFGTTTTGQQGCWFYDGAANVRIKCTAQNGYVAGTWKCLIATYDGSTEATGIKLYEDGVLVPVDYGEDGTYVAMEHYAINTKFGIFHPDSAAKNELVGQLGHIRIYDRVLTEAEIISFSQNPWLEWEIASKIINSQRRPRIITGIIQDTINIHRNYILNIKH